MIVKTQIYLYSAEDAAMVSKAGADFIGLVCDGHSLSPHGLEYAEARKAFAAIQEGTMRVALTIAQNPNHVIDMIRNIHPHVVHLGGTTPMLVDKILDIRRAEPTVKIMQAIPMNSDDPIKMAKQYQMVSDYFLLDTSDPTAAEIGATGKTHDWALSARLVREIQIPVILAGGLSPENVKDAIRTVQPWGVDSYSLTNLEGLKNRKDPEKVSLFIKNVRSLSK